MQLIISFYLGRDISLPVQIFDFKRLVKYGVKIADYFRYEPDIQWEYASQLGVRYAVGRMPDGHMDEFAGSFEALRGMKERLEKRGFLLKVIEPAPPNQKIKLGLPGRDEEIQNMCTLIENMGKLGIEVFCYNFMAYFNWERTGFDYPERGGALVSYYDHSRTDHTQLTDAGIVSHRRLWDNFEYLQKAIVPVAERAGVKLALHPDDPPVPGIRGVGRILISADAMEKAINIVPSPNMGIAMCQGSFQAMGENVVECIRRFGSRIHFVHFRDTRGGRYCFHETFHDNGPTDMAQVIRAYRDIGYKGYVRVDHVPAMAGEHPNHPGYGSVGRLFAIGYLKGLMEMAGCLEE